MKWIVWIGLVAMWGCDGQRSTPGNAGDDETVDDETVDDEDRDAGDENADEDGDSEDSGMEDDSEETDAQDVEETVEEGTNTDREEDTAAEKEEGWQLAAMTWYESYPEEGSEECIEYNGCQWAGWFAGLPTKQTPEWVESHNIASVHEDYFDEYNGKTVRVRKGEHQIDVVVYDKCADSDCDGCCSDNMWATGFLIDMEIHTAERFGVMGGAVEFICLDCDQ